MLNRLMVLLGLFLSLAATTSHAALLDWTDSTFTNGQQYRLVFVTSTTRTATSADIADYNAHVNSAAALNADLSGVTGSWAAIASTSSVDAIDNTATPTSTLNIPIYLVDSNLVASDYANLWSGSIAHAIDVDEEGNAVSAGVWTGSDTDGSVFPAYALGSQFVRFGVASRRNDGWISASDAVSSAERPIFGISQVQTHGATATVPEPTSLMLLSTVAGIGFVARRVRRRPTTSGSGVTRS